MISRNRVGDGERYAAINENRLLTIRSPTDEPSSPSQTQLSLLHDQLLTLGPFRKVLCSRDGDAGIHKACAFRSSVPTSHLTSPLRHDLQSDEAPLQPLI